MDATLDGMWLTHVYAHEPSSIERRGGGEIINSVRGKICLKETMSNTNLIQVCIIILHYLVYEYI